ncbi:MAG: right-handed parallel beta-helix repeat-containing protein [Sedimentisphaerales bacterium]|nr:right-handed parallel beta-helix repeat-containing protein [Sedimentisphaerales bacterium]
MKSMWFLIICVMFSLLVQLSTLQADIVAAATQGKCTCMDWTNPSAADTVQSDIRLRTRESDNTNYKSWLQFDLNAIYTANPGLKGNIVIATLTFTGTADNTQPKLYMVNGLNDAADMEDWDPDTLTWNNAPGNNIIDANLDPAVTTANLYTGTIQPGDGTTDTCTSSDLVSFLNTDTDGIVTFIMTPGWTTYFYNAGSIHPPVLTFSLPDYSVYFVAPDGNDTTGDGSIDYPFATIPKAVSMALPSDTIYLCGGIHYYSDTITISTSGTSAYPLTMQAYLDETVILDFSGQGYESKKKGIKIDGSYWHFKNFTVQYTDDTAIYVSGSYNTLERLIARQNGDTGIHLTVDAAYNLVLNCDSYLNYDPEEFGEDADGFGAKGPTGGGASIGLGNVFRGCRSWNNSDDGFDFWWAGNGVLVENCWAFRNGDNVWGDPNFTGNANGFKLGQGGGEHILIGCVAYDHTSKGFDLNRSTADATGVTLYNCTGLNNSISNFTFLNPTTGAVHVLRNNISYAGTVNIGSLIDDTYNSWNGFTVTSADFISLDETGIDGPRGPNGELPKLGFLRLAADSSMINSGTDVGRPFVGSAPELGAFERAELTGDCEPDGDIDWADLACLIYNWLDTDCGYCSGADLDNDNNVNAIDFAALAENWMQ